MKCPNCGRDETWEDASFCPRCGKQLILIITNVSTVNKDKDDKKIRLQIFQISAWVFLTSAAFLYVSKVVPNFSLLWPWGELITAVIVIIVSGIAAWIMNFSLTNQYLP